MLVRFKKFTKIFRRENHSLAPILLVFIATSLILCPQGTNAFSLLKILGIGDSDKGEDLKISTEADDTSDTFSESPFSFSFDSNSIDDEGNFFLHKYHLYRCNFLYRCFNIERQIFRCINGIFNAMSSVDYFLAYL